MYKVAIIIPIYYNEEEVAACMMKLTQCNYDGIIPTLYLPVTGIRSSFRDSFITNYISLYNGNSGNNSDSAIFNDIIPILDESIFDPTFMMNDIISNGDFEYIAIIEPSISFESLNWLHDLISIYVNYDYKRGLGAICTNNRSHTLKKTDNIKWYVDDWSIIRSLNGDGFGNGVMLTHIDKWNIVGGFNNKNYTNTYAISCYRNGCIVVYAEDVR